MFSKIKTLTSGALAVAVLSFSGCSKNDNNSGDPYENGNGNGNGSTKGIQVKTDAMFGTILTDGDGRTLYFFAQDANGSSGCTGNCESVWPVYHSTGAAAGVDAGKVGEITRPDGSKQSTFRGWPLYYYANDKAAGEVKGDAVNGIWFVAKPDYSLMLVNNQLIGANGKRYTANLAEGDGTTPYFTDGAGMTLYAYAPDQFNTNNFTAADLSNNAVWPIYEEEPGSLPSIITADQIATITVFGKKQLTYKGWPLYYFGQDVRRGDNKGVSVPTPGVWPVVNLNTGVAPQPAM